MSPRTNIAPASEPDRKINYKLETKASSHEGQCIAAGSSVSPPRLVLLTMSIITMLFPAKSGSVCLRSAKSRPQFCESCGATYRWICEVFSALQSTFGPVTEVVYSVQIDALIGIAILPQTSTKLNKKRGYKFGALLWRHLTPERKTET